MVFVGKKKGNFRLRCAFGAGIPGYLDRFFAMKLFFVGKNKVILRSNVRLVRVFQGIWIDFSLRNVFWVAWTIHICRATPKPWGQFVTAQFRAFNERRQRKVSLRAGAIATAEPFLDNCRSYTCPSTVATRSAMISVLMGIWSHLELVLNVEQCQLLGRWAAPLL